MLEEEDITKRVLRCRRCQEKTEEPLRSLSWSLALALDVRMCENLTVTQVCGGHLFLNYYYVMRDGGYQETLWTDCQGPLNVNTYQMST